MDLVRIKDLRVETRIGVTPEERSQPQPVLINVDVLTDLTAAGKSDELEETVDYGEVVTLVMEVARGANSKLLEHLAERIAAAIAPLRGVNGVTVEIGKEQPPLDEDVGRVAVRIERPGP